MSGGSFEITTQATFVYTRRHASSDAMEHQVRVNVPTAPHVFEAAGLEHAWMSYADTTQMVLGLYRQAAEQMARWAQGGSAKRNL